MVSYNTIRTSALTVGLLGSTYLIATNASTPAKVVGILLLVILMVFSFVITSKWRMYIVGEQTDEDPNVNKGYFGS